MDNLKHGWQNYAQKSHFSSCAYHNGKLRLITTLICKTAHCILHTVSKRFAALTQGPEKEETFFRRPFLLSVEWSSSCRLPARCRWPSNEMVAQLKTIGRLFDIYEEKAFAFRVGFGFPRLFCFVLRDLHFIEFYDEWSIYIYYKGGGVSYFTDVFFPLPLRKLRWSESYFSAFSK